MFGRTKQVEKPAEMPSAQTLIRRALLEGETVQLPLGEGERKWRLCYSWGIVRSSQGEMWFEPNRIGLLSRMIDLDHWFRDDLLCLVDPEIRHNHSCIRRLTSESGKVFRVLIHNGVEYPLLLEDDVKQVAYSPIIRLTKDRKAHLIGVLSNDKEWEALEARRRTDPKIVILV